MKYIISMFFLSFALCMSMPVFASDDEKVTEPDVWDRECGDDDGNDRCDPKVQKKMRALYGWKSIEQLAKEGTTAYRAMIIDGYGNDLVAISFERRAGMSPFVEVGIASRDGVFDNNQPLKANVSEEIWSEVIESSKYFDQKFAREGKLKSDENEGIIICLHGWVTVAEAVEINYSRATVYKEGERSIKEKKIDTLRSDTESACARGLAVPYAFRLAKIAHALLTECSTLEIDKFRNIPALLSTCKGLGGDRLAGGHLYHAYIKATDVDDIELKKFKWFFDYDSREQAKQLYDALLNGSFYYESIYADSKERGKVVGKIYKSVENESRDIMANLSLNFDWNGDEFKIISYEIGEFEPVKEE